MQSSCARSPPTRPSGLEPPTSCSGPWARSCPLPLLAAAGLYRLARTPSPATANLVARQDPPVTAPPAPPPAPLPPVAPPDSSPETAARPPAPAPPPPAPDRVAPAHAVAARPPGG